MTCLAFETALNEPDHDASNVQLHKLIADGNYSGHTLPTVAQDYLRAFCNTNLSHTRRRWIGLALAGMLGASPEVVKHLGTVQQQLQGLGDVILGAAEREETKIVAGIIVRQALERNVEFASFWTSDKVGNSALNFPHISGPRWMSEFQSFLDTLGDLALTNSITDPSILFPVSVVSSDSFQGARADEGTPVAIVQHDILTILFPDASLRKVQFLDVPVAHISSTSTGPSAPLHDSQSRQTSHKPWDLTLALKPASWTYLLNTSKRTATELVVLFGQSEDAEECATSIKELQHTSKGAIGRPSDSLPDINPLPPQTGGNVRQQREATHIPLSDASQSTLRRVCRSSPIVIKRRRQPADSQAEMESSSSDQMAKSPSTRLHSPHRSSKEVPVAELQERARPVSNHTRQATKQQRAELAQKQGDVAAARVGGRRKSVQNAETPNPAQNTRQTQNQSRRTQHKKDVRMTASNGVQAQTSDDPAKSSHSIASPTHGTTSVSSSEQALGKGRLQKISSQVTTQRHSQQSPKQLDVFEIPEEDCEQSITREDVISQVTPAAVSDHRPKPKKSKAASRAIPTNSQRKSTRNKRRAEEDDEFIPNATKTTAKRKSVAEVTISNKPSKKTAKIEHKADAENASSLVRTSCSQPGAQRISDATSHPEDGMLSQRSKPKNSDKSHLPAAVSRTPLIGKLLGLQKPPPTPDVGFKKPAIPPRAYHTPSTPIQRRIIATDRPQTPRIPQRSPTINVASSSPPKSMEHDNVDLHSDVGDVEMILSSNSKPLPASPHAESTAISGHADRDDVDLEKTQGELQTARLDPFQQRRREGQMPTSFIRRLTGDMPLDDAAKLTKNLFDSTLIKTCVSMTLSTKEPLANQLALQPEADHNRRHTLAHTQASVSQPPEKASKNERAGPYTKTQLVDAESEVSNRSSASSACQVSHSSKRKAVEVMERAETPRKRRALSSIHHNQTGRSSAATQKVALIHKEGNNIDIYDSVFAVAQGSVNNTQTVLADELQHDLDGDTFINDGSGEQLPTRKPSDPFMCSSPPDIAGTPSSHSSTSAEPEPSSPAPTVPTSEAEAEEWELSLQPHQRALHELLMRVSKRVLRHVVDNETAVTDIAETFATDGTHLLEKLLKKHDSEYKGLWQDLDAKKAVLQDEMERSVKALARERKRVSALI